MRGRFTDLTGQRFGRWIAIRRYSNSIYNTVRWWCRCDCGRERPVSAGTLVSGHSRGCPSCAVGHVFRIKHSWGGEDPEMLAFDVLADLESEFGEMRMPEPRGPVFHQSLSSDFELGIAS